MTAGSNGIFFFFFAALDLFFIVAGAKSESQTEVFSLQTVIALVEAPAKLIKKKAISKAPSTTIINCSLVTEALWYQNFQWKYDDVALPTLPYFNYFISSLLAEKDDSSCASAITGLYK